MTSDKLQNLYDERKEAQKVLKSNPDDVDSIRELARIANAIDKLERIEA